jgi:hypothetical protein
MAAAGDAVRAGAGRVDVDFGGAMKPDAPLTATVAQFKRISGLGKTSIYELIKAGDLRSVRICGRRLIVISSYNDLLDRSQETAESRAEPRVDVG